MTAWPKPTAPRPPSPSTFRVCRKFSLRPAAGERYLHLPGLILTDDGSQTRYLLGDGLGSIRHAVDETAGLVAYHEFEPYGGPVEGGGEPYGFTGEWWEGEVGLLYLRARWYRPEVGIFLSRDLIENEPPYLYVRGNPVNYIDPSGLQCPGCPPPPRATGTPGPIYVPGSGPVPTPGFPISPGPMPVRTPMPSGPPRPVYPASKQSYEFEEMQAAWDRFRQSLKPYHSSKPSLIYQNQCMAEVWHAYTTKLIPGSFDMYGSYTSSSFRTPIGVTEELECSRKVLSGEEQCQINQVGEFSYGPLSVGGEFQTGLVATEVETRLQINVGLEIRKLVRGEVNFKENRRPNAFPETGINLGAAGLEGGVEIEPDGKPFIIGIHLHDALTNGGIPSWVMQVAGVKINDFVARGTDILDLRNKVTAALSSRCYLLTTYELVGNEARHVSFPQPPGCY